MLTHYIRLNKVPRDAKLGGPLESSVLACVPTDQLITFLTLEDRVKRLQKADPDSFDCPPSKLHLALKNAVDNLAKNGFVRELVGARITRWLDSI